MWQIGKPPPYSGLEYLYPSAIDQWIESLHQSTEKDQNAHDQLQEYKDSVGY